MQRYNKKINVSTKNFSLFFLEVKKNAVLRQNFILLQNCIKYDLLCFRFSKF